MIVSVIIIIIIQREIDVFIIALCVYNLLSLFKCHTSVKDVISIFVKFNQMEDINFCTVNNINSSES